MQRPQEKEKDRAPRKRAKRGCVVYASCFSVRGASTRLQVWEAAEASDALNFGLRLRISRKVVCAEGQYCLN